MITFKDLYATKYEMKWAPLFVNQTIQGTVVKSKYHSYSGPIKISLAAQIFDVLFASTEHFAAYKNTVQESVYVELGAICVLVSKDKATDKIQYTYIQGKTDGRSSDGRLCYPLFIPVIIYDLVFGPNTELQDFYKKACSCSTGNSATKNIFGFCDSFYYSHVSMNDFPIMGKYDDIHNTKEQMLRAAFRSMAFEQLSDIINPARLEKSKYDVTTKTAKVKEEVTKSNFLQECRKDVYKVAYDWPESMKGNIIPKTFLDTFETTPEFEEIVRKIKFRADRIIKRMESGLTGADAIDKDYLNIMLLGKPGTGKTTLAYALSAATGMPICTTVHTKHTDEDEYEGKTKIVDGRPAFVETDSLRFHEEGGIDVCEEINLTDPSVTMGGLGQKLEYPFIVKRNGYETKVRHPLNVVIATMNVGTNGSNPLNQALANRFKTPYILDDPTKETFINILKKASGKDEALCTWVYDAYDATVSYLKNPDVNEDEICQNLSIRTCLGAIENMDEGQTPTRALINSLVGAVAVVDLDVARELQHEVIELLPAPDNFTKRGLC